MGPDQPVLDGGVVRGTWLTVQNSAARVGNGPSGDRTNSSDNFDRERCVPGHTFVLHSNHSRVEEFPHIGFESLLGLFCS